MRIAHVAPLYERVPPALYGGTERVVSYLTEELVALGHNVTLFASGDSRTEANFVPCCRSALRLEAEAHDPIPHHMVMLDKLMRVKILPLSFGFPFGFSAAIPPNIPLPSKLVTQVLEPIDIVEQFGEDPDIDEVDAHVRGVMQLALERLGRQRRLPILG